MLLLYPDNEQHVNALDTIIKTYDHCGILHDQDVWTDDSEDHKQGKQRNCITMLLSVQKTQHGTQLLHLNWVLI